MPSPVKTSSQPDFSFSEGILPDLLEFANAIQVFKEGDSTGYSNYRSLSPISNIAGGISGNFSYCKVLVGDMIFAPKSKSSEINLVTNI